MSEQVAVGGVQNFMAIRDLSECAIHYVMIFLHFLCSFSTSQKPMTAMIWA